jgi:hypothetical protein
MGMDTVEQETMGKRAMAQELLPTIVCTASNPGRLVDLVSSVVPAVCHGERTLLSIGASVFQAVHPSQTPAVTQSNLIGTRQILYVERTLPRDVERTALPCGVNPAPQ